MANYIDYPFYDFRDEVLVESYLDVWPRRARSMKTGMLASLVMVILTRNRRYSPRQ